MKHLAPLAALLAAVFSAPSAPPAAVPDELVFAPAEGTTLTKTFEQVLDMTLVDHELSVLLNGEDRTPDTDELEVSFREEETVVLTDVYHAVEDGRATSLSRTFERLYGLSIQDAGDEDTEPSEEASPLEGLTVTFSWDADEEEYAVAFAEEQGDEELLVDLEADADLTWFLPQGDVSEGDSWEVDASAFLKLASPGGDSKIEGEDEDESDDDFNEQFEENLEGEVVCTLESLDGDVAVIAVRMELTSSVEQETEESADGVDDTSTSVFALAFDLTGELTWDVEAGHARALSLEGDVELQVTLELESRAEGFELEVHQEQGFEGTLTMEVSFE